MIVHSYAKHCVSYGYLESSPRTPIVIDIQNIVRTFTK